MDLNLKIPQLRAHGKLCIGCQNTKTAIMISAMDTDKDPTKFYDFFLDQDAAQKFYDELGSVLERNKKD